MIREKLSQAEILFALEDVALSASIRSSSDFKTDRA